MQRSLLRRRGCDADSFCSIKWTRGAGGVIRGMIME
jgi:hypothetical protein